MVIEPSHLFIASRIVQLPNRPKNNDTIALIFVENIGTLFILQDKTFIRVYPRQIASTYWLGNEQLMYFLLLLTIFDH